MIERYVLTSEEKQTINTLTSQLQNCYVNKGDDFLFEMLLLAHKLPEGLKRKIMELKYSERSSNLIVSGYELNDEQIGLTPEHWKKGSVGTYSTDREELFFSLCGSLLGDIFGWATQQDGRYIHDILPIKGNETEQLGSGSEALLWWHTEEAFHEYRADYLGLMCLRNPDHVATTYAAIDMIDLDKEIAATLFERRYYILPDESHLKKNNSVCQENQLAFNNMETYFDKRVPVSVLFGSSGSPYLRIDPYFMGVVDDTDTAAKEALQIIKEKIDACLLDIVLEPGEILFIDNFRAVHGRKPFHAKYSGKDRWLKRINITRDIRKSRDSRNTAFSRLIHQKSEL